MKNIKDIKISNKKLSKTQLANIKGGKSETQRWQIMSELQTKTGG